MCPGRLLAANSDKRYRLDQQRISCDTKSGREIQMLKKLLLLLLHTNLSHVMTRAASAMISLVIRNREDYIYFAFLPYWLPRWTRVAQITC